MRDKEFPVHVEFDVEEWLKKVVKQAAKDEYRPMAAIWRLAVIEKYPELVERFKGEGERTELVKELGYDPDDFDFGDEDTDLDDLDLDED